MPLTLSILNDFFLCLTVMWSLSKIHKFPKKLNHQVAYHSILHAWLSFTLKHVPIPYTSIRRSAIFFSLLPLASIENIKYITKTQKYILRKSILTFLKFSKLMSPHSCSGWIQCPAQLGFWVENTEVIQLVPNKKCFKKVFYIVYI